MVLAAVGADHILVLHNEVVHLGGGHGVHIDGLATFGSLDELVGTMPGAAALAVHQGVGEGAHMTGGDPGLGVHQDGGIQAHIIVGLLDELLKPGLLDVILELHAQRAVVPGVCQAAVDLGAGIDVAPVLAQGHDHIQSLIAVSHGISSIIWIIFLLKSYYTGVIPTNQVVEYAKLSRLSGEFCTECQNWGIRQRAPGRR